jgi:hypothetical protein
MDTNFYAREQAIADRHNAAVVRNEAETMNLAFDNTRGAQRIDESMIARIKNEGLLKMMAPHIASGVLVPLTCPTCGDVSCLRFDNPNVDNWHCFCGDRTPKLMTRTA